MIDKRKILTNKGKILLICYERTEEAKQKAIYEQDYNIVLKKYRELQKQIIDQSDFIQKLEKIEDDSEEQKI
jgi:hypothetical protein